MDAKFCCDFAKKGASTIFFCKNCGRSICSHHATIWIGHVIRCPCCFSEIGVYSPAILHAERIQGGKKSKSKGMSTCVVIDGAYVAGAQSHVLYLLDVLNKAGFNCYIIALYGGGRWFERFRKNCVSMLLAFGDPKSEDPIILNFIRDSEAKSINTHLLTCLERIYDMGLKNYIATIHSFLTPHEYPTKGITDKALRTAATILTPSNHIAEDLISWIGLSPPPIVVIPNCVDIHKFSPSRFSEKRALAKFSISYVGRLDRDKFNINMFIGTIKKLLESGMKLNVEIAGDGELMDELKESLNQHNLNAFVTLFGFVDDVSKIYSSCDLVFFPSLNEGLSISALEAMAMGKVVVATDVGDMKVLSSNNGAIIVPSGDIVQAAKEILLISKNDVLKMKMEKNARKIALNYSVEKWSRHILPIFLDKSK